MRPDAYPDVEIRPARVKITVKQVEERKALAPAGLTDKCVCRGKEEISFGHFGYPHDLPDSGIEKDLINIIAGIPTAKANPSFVYIQNGNACVTF